SCPVFKALPNNAFNRALGTLNIVYAEPDAVAITEIELGKVAMQMLFLAVLIDTLHSALEDRIVALNGVGVDDVGLAIGEAQTLGDTLQLSAAGFVNLNGLASPAHGLHTDNLHGLADAMRHEPRGFEGDAQGAVKLVAADPLLGRTEQVDRLKPQPHGDVA